MTDTDLAWHFTAKVLDAQSNGKLVDDRPDRAITKAADKALIPAHSPARGAD